MTPIVAIVGRPNVGKSTLFNRWAGAKLAIVHDAPGVTRDRHYADTILQGRKLTLIDTGGFDPNSEDPMQQGITRQVQAAIAEADVVVCLLDGLTAPTAADSQAVRLLRQSDKPCLFVANRVDNAAQVDQSLDLYRLGVDHIFAISALHGRGMAELETAICKGLPRTSEPEEIADNPIPRIALVGRPNAGKSSLLNRLAGGERSLVDSRPGTTRDPIDVDLEIDGHRYQVVDTAGIRRKSKVDEAVELESIMRAIRSVERAHVAVLVCDITQGIAEQDQRLLGLCMDRNRALLVALNKCDLLNKDEQKARLKIAADALHFAKWVRVVPMSVKSGFGVKDLMSDVRQVFTQFGQRVPTGELNRFFAEVLERKSPPTQGGRAPRLYYLTQVSSAPPVFVAMCSYADKIKESYKRFVINQLRVRFGFDSVPIVLHFRERSRKER
ncbi:MAG TPA: ribosome biogenesis GTPase Der [Polyangiaceae bacterium]|nr:ribosome biogenesis GTPase Der [Polyangiaceae bacterium]